MIQLATSDTDDGHKRNFDIFVRGFDIRQYPRHHLSVFEGCMHLIDYTICSHSPREQPHLQRGWIPRYEIITVKPMEVFVSNSAGQSRDVIDIRLSYHGGHGSVYIFCYELQCNVFLPDLLQIDLDLERFPEGCQCPRPCNPRSHFIVRFKMCLCKPTPNFRIPIMTA